MDRRQFIRTTSAAAALALTGCGGGGSSGDAGADPVTLPIGGGTSPVPPPTNPSARIIVVGGGMAGATVAKYLRLWGNNLAVTLIDRNASYTSNIMSNLAVVGQRTVSSLQYGYDRLRSQYGIEVVTDEVRSIDPSAPSVTLAAGGVRTADRIIIAPGIAFDDMPGLAANPDAMPHAWIAGPQTTLLNQQLSAMAAGGTVVMSIPQAPYRCPPGPYERACVIADWLRINKPGSKLILLDANADIIVEKDNFSRAYSTLYGSIIEYRPGVIVDSVDTASKTLFTSAGAIQGQVVNLIPRHRAPRLLSDAGLVNDAALRFAKVNVLDYVSTAAPKVHVIGDASSTTQPKAGHIANQEAKVCAEAIIRSLGGAPALTAPVTTSACYSPITLSEASWLHAMYQYDAASQTMQSVPAAFGASAGWNARNFKDMNTWFTGLMADSFA